MALLCSGCLGERLAQGGRPWLRVSGLLKIAGNISDVLITS